MVIHYLILQSQRELKIPNKTLESIKDNYDALYPDFCIPSSPPDLDCKDMEQKKFTVLQPDSHKLDSDKDSIGCES